MPRIFVKISKEDLKKRVKAESKDGVNYKTGLDMKCLFDFENFENEKGSFGPQKLMGINTLKNGLTFWGVCAGGDWEEPVFSILYYDGKCVRSYTPTAGNPWNTKTKQAYGNDEEADIKNKESRKDLPEDGKSFDEDLIEQDIINRIKEKK